MALEYLYTFTIYPHRDPDRAFKTLEITVDVKDKLMHEIQRRLKPQPVTIRSEFEIQCWEYEGVLLIKESLLAGQKKNQDECAVTVAIIITYTISIVRNEGITCLHGETSHLG
jgi:translation initiation factor 2 alpha subunit (eIF-2alpha)